MLGKIALFFTAVLASHCYELSFKVTKKEDFPAAHFSTKIKKVVYINLDGVREKDIKNDLMSLKTDFVLRNFRVQYKGKEDKCAVSNSSNISLPAYASIFSGEQQRNILDNFFSGRISNPTLFDIIEKSYAFSAWPNIQQVMSNSEEIRNKKIFITSVGHLPTPEDISVMESWKTNKDKKSMFDFILFGDADKFAHWGLGKKYFNSISTQIEYIKEIIYLNERMSAQNTFYIISTDHGRGEGIHWINHGPYVPESKYIWILTISPEYIDLFNNSDCNHVNINKGIKRVLGF